MGRTAPPTGGKQLHLSTNIGGTAVAALLLRRIVHAQRDEVVARLQSAAS